jgi:hypothetical protein
MGVSKVGPRNSNLRHGARTENTSAPDYQSCTDRATPPDCGVARRREPPGGPRAVGRKAAAGQLQAYLRRSWPR